MWVLLSTQNIHYACGYEKQNNFTLKNFAYLYHWIYSVLYDQQKHMIYLYSAVPL